MAAVVIAGDERAIPTLVSTAGCAGNGNEWEEDDNDGLGEASVVGVREGVSVGVLRPLPLLHRRLSADRQLVRKYGRGADPRATITLSISTSVAGILPLPCCSCCSSSEEREVKEESGAAVIVAAISDPEPELELDLDLELALLNDEIAAATDSSSCSSTTDPCLRWHEGNTAHADLGMAGKEGTVGKLETRPKLSDFGIAMLLGLGIPVLPLSPSEIAAAVPVEGK